MYRNTKMSRERERGEFPFPNKYGGVCGVSWCYKVYHTPSDPMVQIKWILNYNLVEHY